MRNNGNAYIFLAAQELQKIKLLQKKYAVIVGQTASPLLCRAQLEQWELVHASLLLVYICVLVRVCVERP